MPHSVLCFLQVRLSGYNCFRIDNRCLLLLPFPKTSLSESVLLIMDVIVNLLRLAGDVETNPGPLNLMLQRIYYKNFKIAR